MLSSVQFIYLPQEEQEREQKEKKTKSYYWDSHGEEAQKKQAGL